MLIIYTNIDLADKEVIQLNDIWFDRYRGSIKITDEIKKIVKKIDGGILLNNFCAITADNVTISTTELSTSCKTCINIVCFTDKIIDTTECGDNALEYALTLKNGNILMRTVPVIFDNVPNNILVVSKDGVKRCKDIVEASIEVETRLRSE